MFPQDELEIANFRQLNPISTISYTTDQGKYQQKHSKVLQMFLEVNK
jgi:hypothetical protein